jgi:amino acid transporter
MTLDLVANLLLLFLVSDILAILFAGNLGYMLAHVFALTAFVLLRRDRPGWHRPVRLGAIWIPVALVLAAANLVFLVVGFSDPALAFYGGAKERWIAVGVLLSPLLLFAYRRIVQDGGSIHLREEPRALPQPVVEPVPPSV